MEIPLLPDVVIILGLAVVVILIFQRFKLPTIIGFLATGVIAGPYGLNIINNIHDIEILAEIGIILLLFIIGLEFSLTSLALIKKTVLVGGLIQVMVTIGLVTGVMMLMQFTSAESVFMGFLIALSSTAIVLKLLQDQGEINSPHGKTILGILIFQDIIVVPMMLLTPLLGGAQGNIGYQLLLMLLKGVFVIVFVFVSARYIVPKLLFAVARTKSKELFILSVVGICFAVAWMTSSLGLSLALGAFMAGLIISESEYSHQATGNILPFREIFTSFFFVSIGMLLDFDFMLQNLPIILLFSIMTFLLNGFVGTLASLALKNPIRTSLLVGLALFQVGEFAFILSKVGIDNGVLSQDTYQYFLSVSIITMGATPFVMQFYHSIAGAITAKIAPKQYLKSISDNQPDTGITDLEDHIVIIGYGINGRNVAKAAKYVNIPYTIIEMNADTVRTESLAGESILYGDAVHGAVLEYVNIHLARVVVIAISDPTATKLIITSIRAISDKVHIIVRTRFVLEMEENYRIGANEVVPEEFETSIEIFTRVLNKYLVPRDEITLFTDSIRSDNYSMLRSLEPPAKGLQGMLPDLQEIEVACLRAYTHDSAIIDVPFQEAQIKTRFNVMVVAIKRKGTTILDMNGRTTLEQGDLVYVIGKPEDVTLFENYLSN